MSDLTHTKRLSNGYLTPIAADLSQSNASNGFDFASHPQLPVERAADQALAREKTLPKCISVTTPTAVMAGPGSVIWCARKRPRFRARERRQSGGRGNAERNCLSPAPGARPPGDRPKPGHDNDHNLRCSKKGNLTRRYEDTKRGPIFGAKRPFNRPIAR